MTARRLILTVIGIGLSLALCPRAWTADEHPPGAAAMVLQELKIGDPAPAFSLPGIDGRTHALSDYKEAKILMIAFISNHCPDSHAAEKRIL